MSETHGRKKTDHRRRYNRKLRMILTASAFCIAAAALAAVCGEKMTGSPEQTETAEDASSAEAASAEAAETGEFLMETGTAAAMAETESGKADGKGTGKTESEGAAGENTGKTAEETAQEAAAETEWFYYQDKEQVRRNYLPEEGAALREVEWNNPWLDEFGNPFFQRTDESLPEFEMIRGVDVSAEQGEIDWKKVRDARCDAVMLCADERFEENYAGAYPCGMKIGVFCYSSAADEEEARRQAGDLLAMIGDREVDLFVAYVPENMAVEGPVGAVLTGKETDAFFRNTDTAKNTAIASAFCDVIEEAGYRPAVYSSMRYETEMYDMTELAGKYEFWYSGFGGTPDTPYPFSAWQYCLTGGISGITGPVHLDVFLERPYEEREPEQAICSYTQFYQEAYEMTSWVNYRSVNEKWNGEWARIEAGGQEFMMFGCGICCLSNTVSTLTGTAVPPEEMYYDTKERTSYYPESGTGAVSWDIMKTMCGNYGLEASLCGKPAGFEEFAEDIASADTAVILASGDNDRRLWWYTDGHYVNIWDYDPEDGTVFVTDPSTHYNRLRVKLRDIYNALKTGSSYQYMKVSRADVSVGDGSSGHIFAHQKLTGVFPYICVR